ncbi:MAG: SDR family oxidoreductase [Alphaproteobacteria bacterium]|nr:SDR family oxidoreductase [Alphaproteobacteria bacterium]
MMLSGKRVLITGGGGGLGADMARGFVAAGAEVVITGRRPDALRKVAAGSVAIRALAADVTQEAEVKQLFAAAGPVDIVIANAGAAESAPFARTSLEHWNHMLAVNLTGVFITFREGLAQMGGWGRLIAIASMAGLKGYPYVAPYAAAKHGVVGLTRSLALEIVAKPITVNAICPGFLDTEMTARSVANIVLKTGRSQEAALEALLAADQQKRLISPAQVTAKALWLCGPDSECVNGEAIAMPDGEA